MRSARKHSQLSIKRDLGMGGLGEAATLRSVQLVALIEDQPVSLSSMEFWSSMFDLVGSGTERMERVQEGLQGAGAGESLPPDPQALRLGFSVNGEALQGGSNRDIIFGVTELLSRLSRPFTLQSGDELLMRFEGIGELMNPMVGS